MEPKYTCSPNTLGINTAMFGSAASLTRNPRLLPGLLGHSVGKLGWLVGYLVRRLLGWPVGWLLLSCWWFDPLGGCLFSWLVWLLGWFVVWLAGWLVDGLVGYLVRRWWVRSCCWLAWLVGCLFWLAGLAQPANAWSQAQGPSKRGKWEGAKPNSNQKTLFLILWICFARGFALF